MSDLALSVWLFAPLFAGIALNGVFMKFRMLPSLARPIDGGRTWRGVAIFGASKTWRGIAAAAAGTGIVYLVRALAADSPREAASLAHWLPATAFGIVLGAAAMASELVNSFVKRRLGIAPGAAATAGLRRGALYVFDQIDFLIGGWIVAAFVIEPTVSRIAWSSTFVLVAHQVVSFAGAALGMRSSAR